MGPKSEWRWSGLPTLSARVRLTTSSVKLSRAGGAAAVCLPDGRGESPYRRPARPIGPLDAAAGTRTFPDAGRTAQPSQYIALRRPAANGRHWPRADVGRRRASGCVRSRHPFSSAPALRSPFPKASGASSRRTIWTRRRRRSARTTSADVSVGFMFGNQGQVCEAPTGLLVQRGIRDIAGSGAALDQMERRIHSDAGFSALGAGAQDHDDQRRHPRHREYQRRS